MEKRKVILRNQLGNSWYKALEEHLESEWFIKLEADVAARRLDTDNVVSPTEDKVYQAFRLCPLEDTKVVIIGELPSQFSVLADGLAFSSDDPFDYHEGQKVIFSEMDRDIYGGASIPREKSLVKLAIQGVMLLNIHLTSERDRKSHTRLGWSKLTLRAIKMLAEDDSPKVFMTWGSTATKALALATKGLEHSHVILAANSPIAAEEKEGEGFIGSGVFSKCNGILRAKCYTEIDW